MFFTLCHLLYMFSEIFFNLLYHSFMLLVELRDEHLVVWFAAVLQKNSENSPQIRKHDIFILGMVETTLKHFIETYTVDEQTSVYTIHLITWHTWILSKWGKNNLTVNESRSIWYLETGFLCSGLRTTPGISRCSASLRVSFIQVSITFAFNLRVESFV